MDTGIMGNSERTVVFVHIPKTAGSTLNKIVFRAYPSAQICQLYDDRIKQSVERFSGLSDSDRRQFRVVIGHVGFGLHRLIPGPVTYLTMLRDPVERIVSYYYFVRRRPDHFLHADCQSMSLKEFADSDLTHKLSDGQVKYLAELDGQVATPETLELAKSNVERHFASVGLLERFDESLALLRRAAGWPMVWYDKENVTSDRPALASLPVDAVETIARRNSLDRALYAWVAERLERSIAAAGLSLRAEVNAVRTVNRVRRGWRRALRRRPGRGG